MVEKPVLMSCHGNASAFAMLTSIDESADATNRTKLARHTQSALSSSGVAK